MAKIQKRRTISVSGLTYERWRARCTRLGVSMAGEVERMMVAKMDADGEPVPSAEPVPAQAKTPAEQAAEHFTF